MAAAPRVTSMRFFRYGCDEQRHPLFQPSYSRCVGRHFEPALASPSSLWAEQWPPTGGLTDAVIDNCRSNRMRGVKILRCFPHCCPDHMPRRYCGCSLHLMVEFDRPLTQEDEQQLVVCARFEAPMASGTTRSNKSDGTANLAVLMEVGTMARLPGQMIGDEDAAGEESTADQMWVRAVKESERRQQQASLNAVVFSLNNRRFPRWIYNYERDATRQQRDMQHCLRAYVFLLGSAEAEHSQLATVIAHHASPGFVLYSYRRAKSTATKRLEDDYSTQRLDDLDRISLRHNRAAIIGSGLSARAPRSEEVPEVAVSRYFDHGSLNRVPDLSEAKPAPLRVQDRAFNDSLDICNAQHSQEANTREKLQHLHILLLFLNSIWIDDFEAHSDNLTSVIQERWLRPLLTRMDPSMTDAYLSTFSLYTLTTRLRSGSYLRHIASGHHTHIEIRWAPVIADCVETVVRAMDPTYTYNSLVAVVLSSGQSDRTVMNSSHSDKLSAFKQFVGQVYKTIGSAVAQTRAKTPYLRTHSQVESLVDDVVSHVYQDTSLSTVVPKMLDILRGEDIEALNAVLYRKFVALTNEAIVADRGCSRCRSQFLPSIEDAYTSSACQDWWRHLWLFNTYKFERIVDHGHQCAFSGQVAPCSLTILQLLWFLRQCLCIDIDFDGTLLTIKSALAEQTELSHSCSEMSLVMDGRIRVFRAFPDGLPTASTLASSNEWAWGDYCGQVGDDYRSLELILFCFREHSGEKANTELSDEHEETVSAPEAVRFDIHMTLLEDDASNELSVDVKLSHSVCNSGDERTYDVERDCDLRGIPCSIRAELFSSLNWQPLESFKVTYDRIDISNSE